MREPQPFPRRPFGAALHVISAQMALDLLDKHPIAMSVCFFGNVLWLIADLISDEP